MATIANFTVQADAFLLGSLFRGYPDIEIELERMVPSKPALVPYIWLRNLDSNQVTQLLATAKQESAVKNIRAIDEVNGARLLRLDWEPERVGLMRAISEMNGALISGVGTADSWAFEIRSDAHTGITRFQNYCHDHDIPILITSVYELSSVNNETEDGLTDSQREALILAYEHGYYRSPREVTLDELANEFGITGQALGSRLNRGVNSLIERTLIDTE